MAKLAVLPRAVEAPAGQGAWPPPPPGPLKVPAGEASQVCPSPRELGTGHRPLPTHSNSGKQPAFPLAGSRSRRVRHLSWPLLPPSPAERGPIGASGPGSSVSLQWAAVGPRLLPQPPVLCPPTVQSRLRWAKPPGLVCPLGIPAQSRCWQEKPARLAPLPTMGVRLARRRCHPLPAPPNLGEAVHTPPHGVEASEGQDARVGHSCCQPRPSEAPAGQADQARPSPCNGWQLGQPAAGPRHLLRTPLLGPPSMCSRPLRAKQPGLVHPRHKST